MTERLQKILSAAGVASRRASEELIREGHVTVNGHQAAVGMSADPERDTICVDGQAVFVSPRRRYIMLHKPRGYVTTLSDEKGRHTVAELISDAGGRLYPVGRLDMDSEGLLILTDDGALANALMHPSHEVNKLYTVFVQGDDIKGSVKRLSEMDRLEGYPIRRPQVMLIELRGRAAELQITIHEGKNRQIRRMCAQAGLSVSRLIRVAEGGVTLGELPCGQWRSLTRDEISSLKEML